MIDRIDLIYKVYKIYPIYIISPLKNKKPKNINLCKKKLNITT